MLRSNEPTRPGKKGGDMPNDHRYVGEIERAVPRRKKPRRSWAWMEKRRALLQSVLFPGRRAGPLGAGRAARADGSGCCRRSIANPHDVDDAFQATFLILVPGGAFCGTGTGWGPGFMGWPTVWRCARSDAARQRALEQSAARVEIDAWNQVPDRLVVREEQCAAVDEEIAQLPAPGAASSF